MAGLSFFFLISCIISLTCAAHTRFPRTGSAQCQTLNTTFAASTVYPYHSTRQPATGQFVAISPEGTYEAAGNGLKLFLEKPTGTVTTKDGVNDKVADGATINSTFTILYGKVSFEVSGPVVPGIVTATIIIADERDEIDIELLGGDPKHWQTNVYAPASPSEPAMWGVFSDVEDIPKDGTIDEIHTYTIDWNANRIIWSVDGQVVRTLTPEQTRKNGALHYPSHPARIQMGIWDASSPAGTAAWAKGPVNWAHAPSRMSAVVKSVTVECP